MCFAKSTKTDTDPSKQKSVYEKEDSSSNVAEDKDAPKHDLSDPKFSTDGS